MGGLAKTAEALDQLFGTSLTNFVRKRRERRKIGRKWKHIAASFPIPAKVQVEITDILSEIEFYWTPVEKQVVMASLIIRDNLQSAVEIGVYTGGSLIPQAVAMRHTGGMVIGIDPYSDVEAQQRDNRDLLDQVDPAVLKPDRDKMHDSVVDLIRRCGLSPHCRILRATSNAAAGKVSNDIDMLHIDGNHDLARVTDDLENYLPKLRVGGYLVMDDINWGTIAPLYRAVREQMEVVFETDAWGCCLRTQETIRLT